MTDFRLPAEPREPSGLHRILLQSTEYAKPFMVTAAVLAVAGNPFFYLVWAYLLPQPYESLGLRLVAAAICLPLVFKDRWPEPLARWLPYYWHFAVLFTLPYFFSLFLFLNGFSQMWLLTSIGGIFLLTFMVHWIMAAIIFPLGSALAWLTYAAMGLQGDVTAPLVEIVIVALFVLGVGGVVNFRLQQFRDAQMAFEKRLRLLSGQNAVMMREHNHLLGRFLNNILINRLRKFQDEHGLEAALNLITRQERRFCGIMQADIRNFTRMFDVDTELEVAQLVSQCFSEITAIGQDLAVIKPVGDCIFLYSDDEQGREEAVLNILTLASLFVNSVERINRALTARDLAPLNFGIAVHAGEVIYGNLASDTMIDPTVIGLNVNMTARMEELTKSPAVKEVLGANAVIMSEEFYWFVRRAYGRVDGILPLSLDELGVSIRDFPTVRRVYGLPKETSLAFYPVAMERIRGHRLGRAPTLEESERGAHLGVDYRYEVKGMGPNTTWTLSIDVTRFSDQEVSAILRERVPHLEASISQGAQRWLSLSTEQEPGEYDETDVEAWATDLIERLSAGSAPATGAPR